MTDPEDKTRDHSTEVVTAAPADVASVDSVVRALYETISFATGKQPDWDRLRSLFLDGGRLIPAGRPAAAEVQSLDIEGFIAASTSALDGNRLIERGFREREISRRVDAFGNIAHVLSTYESSCADETTPFARGINSIQLVHDKNRWWVVTILWDDERQDNPIPEHYL